MIGEDGGRWQGACAANDERGRDWEHGIPQTGVRYSGAACCSGCVNEGAEGGFVGFIASAACNRSNETRTRAGTETGHYVVRHRPGRRPDTTWFVVRSSENRSVGLVMYVTGSAGASPSRKWPLPGECELLRARDRPGTDQHAGEVVVNRRGEGAGAPGPSMFFTNTTVVPCSPVVRRTRSDTSSITV